MWKKVSIFNGARFGTKPTTQTRSVWVGKGCTGLVALPGVHGEVPCAGGSEVGCAKAT